MKSLSVNAKGELRQFHSPDRVAKALDVHKRTVLRWVANGTIKEVYSLGGGLFRIPGDEIERLLRERSISRKS